MLNVVIFVESVVHRSNWRSRETETVGNRRERPGVIMPKLSIRHFFANKKFRAIPFFFESATGNSWKQLGLVPLTRQKKSYLKPFKVHFLYKLVLNSSFFAESKVRAPTVSRCTFKKMGLRGQFFFAKKWRIDNFGMITPGRSRLFPTVSVSLECQLDLWTTDSTKITKFNTFPDDPSARRLLEMMHFDFETQYTQKKSQNRRTSWNSIVRIPNVQYIYIYINSLII